MEPLVPRLGLMMTNVLCFKATADLVICVE